MKVLLTGGCGYIGSHVAIVLSKAGHEVMLLDNFHNSNKKILNQIGQILNRTISVVEGDIRDTYKLINLFRKYNFECVMHFAGLKSVSESTKNPIDYFDNNVNGTLSLLRAMLATNSKKLVFSSSATVYGIPQYLPLDENHPVKPINPYGRTKQHIEEMLTDMANTDPSWQIACLRYFNPVGAHETGLLGEDPNDIPSNLMPYLAQVALGKLPFLNVYGIDYKTPDGTGIRDYIHIMDLAEGHLAAFDYINEHSGFHIFNLGTGKGNSVLEMIRSFENASSTVIPIKIRMRRFGDVPVCYAKVEKANNELKWRATRTIEDICSSVWNFQRKNKC